MLPTIRFDNRKQSDLLHWLQKIRFIRCNSLGLWSQPVSWNRIQQIPELTRRHSLDEEITSCTRQRTQIKIHSPTVFIIFISRENPENDLFSFSPSQHTSYKLSLPAFLWPSDEWTTTDSYAARSKCVESTQVGRFSFAAEKRGGKIRGPLANVSTRSLCVWGYRVSSSMHRGHRHTLCSRR